MKKSLVSLAVFLFSAGALACSLEVTSETYLGYNGGSACVNISEVRTDSKGQFRAMGWDERTADGELIQHPATALRAGMTRVLKAVEVPGMGTMNVITMRAVSINTATLSFLNGNTLTIRVDANGRATPEKICVQQAGVTQVRGYEGKCP